MQQTSKTFSTMLKLIRVGALIGGVKYKEIYMDSEIDDKTNPPITLAGNVDIFEFAKSYF
jgi:hypothetical protein